MDVQPALEELRRRTWRFDLVKEFLDKADGQALSLMMTCLDKVKAAEEADEDLRAVLNKNPLPHISPGDDLVRGSGAGLRSLPEHDLGVTTKSRLQNQILALLRSDRKKWSEFHRHQVHAGLVGISAIGQTEADLRKVSMALRNLARRGVLEITAPNRGSIPMKFRVASKEEAASRSGEAAP